ncbi:hypothetical protein [Saccharopolyspora spinosa]|uniref:hypothetical protein n=1 Tax=Saccharopolyspora spinosa TaxID=60894 RepID=UPI000497A1A3|nr:hypothetical protein [Saccharopolyspora spinosa]
MLENPIHLLLGDLLGHRGDRRALGEAERRPRRGLDVEMLARYEPCRQWRGGAAHDIRRPHPHDLGAAMPDEQTSVVTARLRLHDDVALSAARVGRHVLTAQRDLLADADERVEGKVLMGVQPLSCVPVVDRVEEEEELIRQHGWVGRRTPVFIGQPADVVVLGEGVVLHHPLIDHDVEGAEQFRDLDVLEGGFFRPRPPLRRVH